MATTQQRFDQKYQPEPNSGCFIWLGSTDVEGYGRFGLYGKNFRASRASWHLHRGDPGTLHVLHRCDNRLCVNPDHLFLGTNHDNCMDKARKGRVPHAKIGAQAASQIRVLRSKGWTLRQLGERFDVDISSINQVLSRRTYAYVA